MISEWSVSGLRPWLLGLLLCCGSTQAQNVHIVHCLGGCPTGTADSNELLVRHLFAVSVNRQTRIADWVAYRVFRDTVGVASLLPREWHEDELSRFGLTADAVGKSPQAISQPSLDNQQDQAYRLTEIQVNPADQGRLVPMSSFAATDYWADLNRLTVLSPLRSDMRLGPLARLDQAINALARSAGELGVFSGPVGGNAADSDGQPEAFFRIVALPDGRAAAFLLLQGLPRHADYCAQLTSIAEVERLTGLDFFPRQAHWPTGDLHPALGCP